jgi:hypothetical protein
MTNHILPCVLVLSPWLARREVRISSFPPILFQVSGAEGGGSQGAASGTDNLSIREAKDVFFALLILMSLLVIALDFILLVHSLSRARSLLLHVQPTRQSMKISIGWRRAPLCEGKKVSLLTRLTVRE